jgi:hypothetical protein
MKHLEIIADNLSKPAGIAAVSQATDDKGRQFWVAAAEREDAGRFIVHADQELPAFLGLESAIREGTSIRNTS